MALTKVQTIGIETGISLTGVTTVTTLNASTDTLSVGGTVNFGGNVSIAGTLTYEDVTNIDSVGIITARAGIEIPDNQKVFLGTDNDLQIYHDGSNARIKNTTGQLWLQSDNGIRFVDSDVNESTARFTDNGAVELYYDGTKKFETTSAGISIHEDTDKVVAFTGGIGEIGNVTGFQALNTAGSALVDFGMRANTLRFATGSAERARIDSSGNFGVGTDSPNAGLNVGLGGNTIPTAGASTGSALFGNATGGNAYGLVLGATSGGVGYIAAQRADGTSTTYNLIMQPNGGSIGVGTDSPTSQSGKTLHLHNGGGQQRLHLTTNNSGSEAGKGLDIILEHNTDGDAHILNHNTNGDLKLGAGDAERLRLDSAGRLLAGTGSSSGNFRAVLQGNAGNNSAGGDVLLARGSATPANAQALGLLGFSDNTHTISAQIQCNRDGGTWSSSSKPTLMAFQTCANGSSTPTERMRINSTGDITVAKSTTSINTDGILLGSGGLFTATRSNSYTSIFNRGSDDGSVIIIAGQNTHEGSISVSGSTVSYNGGHLSRWSQLAGGAERTEILRGSVLSNLDEMCEWGEEDNEQLNRMKISDVEGDVNVAGVFQDWDDDDDTYTNDFYCAMTGDFVIRIAQGTTVARGDLLMSAGDGTAKPQGDGYIQDKTIAKVTSTTVATTYSDGSYCVPCVLMAC